MDYRGRLRRYRRFRQVLQAAGRSGDADAADDRRPPEIDPIRAHLRGKEARLLRPAGGQNEKA